MNVAPRLGLVSREITSSVRMVLGLAAAVGELGHDGRGVLEAARVPLTANPEARVAYSRVLRAWAAAERIAGDADLGLHVAENAPLGTYGVIEYAFRASDTLGEAFSRLCRLQYLLHDHVWVRLRLTGDSAALVRTLPYDGPESRQMAEMGFATYVLYARRVVGLPLVPRAVHLVSPQPPDIREHLRIFGLLPLFSAHEDAVVFDREVLALPLRTADPNLSALLDGLANDMLGRLTRTEAPFHTRVVEIALDHLPSGEPTLHDIAHALGTSRRNLQRRLAAEGTTLTRLLDGLRREMAVRHLGQASLSISEVALLLGFSEPSAFHRAFRRWFGITPREFRRDALPQRDPDQEMRASQG